MELVRLFAAIKAMVSSEVNTVREYSEVIRWYVGALE